MSILPHLYIFILYLLIYCRHIFTLEGDLTHHQAVQGDTQGPDVSCLDIDQLAEGLMIFPNLARIWSAVCLLTQRFRSCECRGAGCVGQQGVRTIKLIAHPKVSYFDLNICGCDSW